MFGPNKPIVFDPYGKRRSRARVPRWLLLLLSGTLLGAAAVVFVQERHLPQRLSAEESVQLRSAYAQAESERVRLAAQLDSQARRFEIALAETKGLGEQLAATRAASNSLRANLASVVAALPPDPRGGSVAVRAARLEFKGQGLAYDVLVSRERNEGKPLAGAMQLVVAGQSARGAAAVVDLEPIAFTVGSFESLRGNAALPEGFKPRQATVKLLDRADGKLLGMRVINVK